MNLDTQNISDDDEINHLIDEIKDNLYKNAYNLNVNRTKIENLENDSKQAEKFRLEEQEEIKKYKIQQEEKIKTRDEQWRTSMQQRDEQWRTFCQEQESKFKDFTLSIIQKE